MKAKTETHQPGLLFSERMVGGFTRDQSFTSHLLRAAKATAKEPFEFIATIQSQDLDAMLADREHCAGLSGTVKAPTLSPEPLMMTGGIFNLFVIDPAVPESRLMLYQFKMHAVAGAEYFVEGLKIIETASIVDVWHDTTTLYITVYDGPDRNAPVLGCGVLRIAPTDFLKQLTTFRVPRATNFIERVAGVAKYQVFFANTVFQHYGGLLARPRYFDPGVLSRPQRTLKAPPPVAYPFVTGDDVELRLTRYQSGKKGPVMLAHGFGVSSRIFSTDLIEQNLVEFLCAHEYDVWTLDLRFSIDLDPARQSDGDQTARYDYPGAISKIRHETGAESVQCLAHSWGAPTFFMSLLQGLEGVRSFVASQIGIYTYSPPNIRFVTGLHLADLLAAVGSSQLDASARGDEIWLEKGYDKALQAWAMLFAQGRCTSATCHRVTFMYGSLYEHDQLNEELHDHLDELFGVANTRTFQHISKICRKGYLVNFKDENTYLPHLDRLNLPIAFIQGGDDKCFLPKGTKRTYDRLCSRFNPDQYSYHLIPGYGHIDCIFGKDAAKDVYPHILEHLEKTALDQQTRPPATRQSSSSAALTTCSTEGGVPDRRSSHQAALTIRWPEEYDPSHACVHVSNSIDISASAEEIWAWLIRAALWPSWYPNSRNVRFENPPGPDLAGGTRFRWRTFGITIESIVEEYVPFERLAWTATASGLRAYHAWLIQSSSRGCQVLTEETQNGFLAWLQKLLLPTRMYHYHQIWLEQLKLMAEMAPAAGA